MDLIDANYGEDILSAISRTDASIDTDYYSYAEYDRPDKKKRWYYSSICTIDGQDYVYITIYCL